MKKVLIVIESDPSASARPCEAFRVALGLTSGPLEVTVVATGNASQAVGPDPWQLVEGDSLEGHRSNFLAGGGTCLVQEPAPPGAVGREISAESLARAVAESDRVMVF